ncbi:hypothetical protein C770_GR4pD1094 (plasmid) [Sinorhizobium meliloti GR4]|nr:hypothetical protein C770_GR4pD1094 [Sinorhizobium meliloti GR4]
MRYEALQLSDMCDCSRVEIQRRKQPSEIGTPIKRRVGWNVPEQSHFEAGHFYAGSGSGSGRGLSSPPPSSSFGHHACQLSLNTPPRPKFPALPNCERFKQSSPLRVNPDVLPDGESHLANIVCARSALRQESNDIAFQEQFRADPATSHGMLVAGLLAGEGLCRGCTSRRDFHSGRCSKQNQFGSDRPTAKPKLPRSVCRDVMAPIEGSRRGAF